jgi:hypothetical protein
MKKLIATIVFFSMLWGIGNQVQAQSTVPTGQLGGLSEQVFNIQDLTSRQGFVTISPNYQVLLEFPDLIDEVAFNNPSLVQYTVPKGGETRLYLNALKTAGNTDMVVVVAGKTLLFRVSINGSAYNGIRKYTVRAPAPVEAPATPTPPAANVSSLNANSVLPQGFQILLMPSIVPNGGITIPYSLVNAGPSNVVATRDNLSVYSIEDGKRIEQSYQIKRTSSTGTSSMVNPNATEVGLISIAEPSKLARAELFVEWRLVEQSTRKTFVYRSRIDFVNGTAEAF